MDIYIVDEFSTNPQFLGLFEFVEPFSRRIRSLELQMKRYRSPDETHRAQGYLLTEYLKAGAGSLKRLSLITQFMRESDSERPHRFIESTSNPSDRNGLGLYLPHSDLEEILHPISELWLAGLYFNWTSKAYRGLTLLRLEEGSCSIPESQLLEILASSPQLRWLDIGLKISQDTASPEPIHLPHLEVLVDTENIPLLRLVYPGSNELTLSIPGTDTATLDTIQSTRLKDFVSHANVTTFYSSDFLRNTSDVHYLLSIAPSIRILALSYFIFTDALVQVVHDSRATVILDKLFILNECKLECSALRSMIGTYRVKKLVFWGCPTDYHGHDAWNEQTLMEELSDLGDVSIQFIPESDDSILDQFLGPII
ncbi:hypothetical protein FRC11_003611 [Ceratobasidium sp. 423]|nr:hypothetical protein FRC11_003611 [Ceratobasidium sp. 423]